MPISSKPTYKKASFESSTLAEPIIGSDQSSNFKDLLLSPSPPLPKCPSSSSSLSEQECPLSSPNGSTEVPLPSPQITSNDTPFGHDTCPQVDDNYSSLVIDDYNKYVFPDFDVPQNENVVQSSEDTSHEEEYAILDLSSPRYVNAPQVLTNSSLLPCDFPRPSVNPIEDERSNDAANASQTLLPYFCTFCNVGIRKFWQHMIRKHNDKVSIQKIENLTTPMKKKRKISYLRNHMLNEHDREQNERKQNKREQNEREQNVKEENQETHYKICKYCSQAPKKYWQHVKRFHGDEEEVQRIEGIQNPAEKRHKILEFSKENFSTENHPFLRHGTKLCPHCKRELSSANLYKHVKVCWERKLTLNTKLLSSYADFERMKQVMPDQSESLLKVLSKLRKDEVADLIKKDPLILEFAMHLVRRYWVNPTQNAKIRSTLREIARFLILIKSKDSAIKELRDVYQPRFYSLFQSTIAEMAGYRDNTMQKPSIALNLGPTLKEVSERLLIMSIAEGNTEVKNSVKDFQYIYKADYYVQLGKPAKHLLGKRKWDSCSLLPTSRDVEKLHIYLKEKINHYTKVLEIKFDYTSYIELTRHTLVQMIVFNRRRTGEIEKMLLENYLKRAPVNTDDELYDSLSIQEKVLSTKYVLTKIRGKHQRPLIVLLSTLEIKSLDIIMRYRTNANISDTNPFLFGYYETYISGGEAIRRYAENCGAESPSLLRSTKLRKHIATISQALEFTESERKMLADYMGHDWQTHRMYYEMPDEISAATKVARILLAFENNEIQANIHKNLNEMMLDVPLDFSPDTLEEGNDDDDNDGGDGDDDDCHNVDDGPDLLTAKDLAEFNDEEESTPSASTELRHTGSSLPVPSTSREGKTPPIDYYVHNT